MNLNEITECSDPFKHWEIFNCLDKETLNEMDKKIKVDGSIIRNLTVKYKKLDTKKEFFKKEK